MSETLTPREGTDFVTPDESHREEDPEKAEQLARASNSNRTSAAYFRRQAMVEQGKSGISSEKNLVIRTYNEIAREMDDRAASNEEFESLRYDMEKLVSSLTPEEIEKEIVKAKEEFQDIGNQMIEVGRKKFAPWKSKEKDDNKKLYFNLFAKKLLQEYKIILLTSGRERVTR